MTNRPSTLSGVTRELDTALQQTARWLSDRNYAGYEPYDFLNSPYLSAGIFHRPPLSFALIQFGKRLGSLRLRELLRVPASKNPKALGLTLAAFCDLERGGKDFSREAEYLKSELKRLRSPNEKEYCWGYDWDYMSARGARMPAFSPNSIASYFCGEALLDMANVFGDREAAAMGESVGRFIVSRLNRSLDSAEHLCFSYTPGDQNRIYNSSALAGAYLARLASRKPNAEYLALARRVMNYLCSEQLPEGGWYYGTRRSQRWIDSFHTSYNLCALQEYRNASGDASFDECLQRGHRYYCGTFFNAEGAPKYYHDQLYPIDIHSCSQAILHFCAFRKNDPVALDQALHAFHWTQRNMSSGDGTYYYQRHRTWTNRTTYTRWGQAWMLRALARLWLQSQSAG